MLALTTAFFTAALGLFGSILFGLWGRYCERRSVAAALAGEIGAYVKLLDPTTSASAYRSLAQLDDSIRRRRLRSTATLPTGHPVFDKVADKIGLLPSAEALDISSIYNVVSGLRIIVSSLSSDQIAAADDAVQISLLNFIADSIEKHCLVADDLVERLEKISCQSFKSFIASETERFWPTS